MEGAVTFDYYRALIENKQFQRSIGYSLYLTVVSTGISLVIGAWLVHELHKQLRKHKWQLLVWVPMLLPHFVAGYLVVLLFSQSGLLSSLFATLHVTDSIQHFPELTNDRYGVGIILTYVWKEVPFVILMLLPVYEQMNTKLSEVVTTLGGRKREVFRYAQWPVLWPVYLEIALILIAFLLSAFEVPYLLGVTSPKAAPVLAYQWFYEGQWEMRPYAQALMMVITICTISLAFLIAQSTARHRDRLAKGQ
nr:ABC transporter permease subunit [Metabacillus iocasae]